MPLPRMRTAEGVLAEIKGKDPDSEITLHYIRAIIRKEQVPVVAVGRKKLVDVDAVLEFLAHGGAQAEYVTTREIGRIRKVDM